MAATVLNLISGPGDLFSGPFGSTEPAATSVGLASSPTTPFVDVGGTSDGVNMTVEQAFFELEVDQVVDRVGSRITKRGFTLQANMAEPTLENLAISMNSTAGVTTSGSAGTTVKSLEPNVGTSVTQPTYRCLIFDGWAPATTTVDQNRRRVVGRRMLSTDNVAFAYKKGAQTILTVTWTAHYVSSSIKPYQIIDAAPA